MTRRCVAVLGGSFDPVHVGHVALAEYFIHWLNPDELRLLPAGNPWQKGGLRADARHRVEMLRLAFDGMAVPVTLDDREIVREGATYTIDTLRELREELGAETAIAFLLGADQLQKLHTWKDWTRLFDYAHLCAASRPGFTIGNDDLAGEVAREFLRRAATPEQMRNTPNGLTCLASNLALDVSATEIRAALQEGRVPAQLPPRVLDYIQQHHLYQTNGH
jgi:nicotinate-nucleotide adenylyltransferase